MQSYEIGTNEAGQRLDKFLHKFFPEAGSAFLYKMLRKKNITVNKKKADGKEILISGDILQFFFADETFEKFRGVGSTKNELQNEYEDAYRQLKGVQILYEDENILALNKPAGILTQKATPKDSSLNEWMIGYLLANKKLTEASLHTFKPSVVNRLDRNTSGLVLCGISLKGSQMLSKLIHDRSLKKYYQAIVKGTMEGQGLLRGILKKDEKTNMVSIDKNRDGANILTAYQVLSKGKNATLLEVELITGKTHQIRAHMAFVNHPLVGDYKYGDADWNQTYRKKYGVTSQLLHAQRVEFPELPAPFEALSRRVITAPVPHVFEEVMKECQHGIPEA